jgi:hypothetical protein
MPHLGRLIPVGSSKPSWLAAFVVVTVGVSVGCALGGCELFFHVHETSADASISTDEGGDTVHTDGTRPSGRIPCGEDACAVPSGSCCVTDTQDAASFACMKGSGGACTGTDQFILQCRDSNTCEVGSLCCMVYEPEDHRHPSLCIKEAPDAPEQCPGGHVLLCDTSEDAGCPSGRKCGALPEDVNNIPPGYSFCQPLDDD